MLPPQIAIAISPQYPIPNYKKKVIKAEAVYVCDKNSAKHAMHCLVGQFAPTINDFFQISTG